MIKLIDPKRQAELEEIIVQLGVTVSSLTENMEYLRDSNRQLVNELRGTEQTLRRLEAKFSELERSRTYSKYEDPFKFDTRAFTRTAPIKVQYDNLTSMPTLDDVTRVNIASTPTSSSSPIRDFYEDYTTSVDGTRVLSGVDIGYRSDVITRAPRPVSTSYNYRNSDSAPGWE